MDIQIWLARDKRNKILNKAKECIQKYGHLRYCKSQVCACMGCVNHTMSLEEYEQALKMPEIQEILDKLPKRDNKMTKERALEFIKIMNEL